MTDSASPQHLPDCFPTGTSFPQLTAVQALLNPAWLHGQMHTVRRPVHTCKSGILLSSEVHGLQDRRGRGHLIGGRQCTLLHGTVPGSHRSHAGNHAQLPNILLKPASRNSEQAELAAGLCSLTPDTSHNCLIRAHTLSLDYRYCCYYRGKQPILQQQRAMPILHRTPDHAVPGVHTSRTTYACVQEARALTFCLIQGCWPACLRPLPAFQSP